MANFFFSFQSGKLYQRFQDSYGAWCVLREYVERFEFLKLQLLNRKAYRTTISRAQTAWFKVNHASYKQVVPRGPNHYLLVHSSETRYNQLVSSQPSLADGCIKWDGLLSADIKMLRTRFSDEFMIEYPQYVLRSLISGACLEVEPLKN